MSCWFTANRFVNKKQTGRRRERRAEQHRYGVQTTEYSSIAAGESDCDNGVGFPEKGSVWLATHAFPLCLTTRSASRMLLACYRYAWCCWRAQGHYPHAVRTPPPRQRGVSRPRIPVWGSLRDVNTVHPSAPALLLSCHRCAAVERVHVCTDRCR